MRTMMEIHGDVIASNIRGHCNDRSRIKLTYQVAGGYSIQIRHDDIHQNQVVFGSSIHFVDGFQPIQLQKISRPSGNSGTTLTALSMAQWKA